MNSISLIRRISIALAAALFFSSCATLSVVGGEGAWARATLRKLTLREKIAQMMIYRMNMRFLNEESEQWQEIVELINTDGIGGIHLWAGDVGMSLTMMNQMQKMSKVPIIFDADIERGIQDRFPAGTPLPVLMAQTATGDPEYAYQAGRITALEGRALGIGLNLTPVVDVNNNPANPVINTRSFGEDPESVIEFSLAFIHGMRDHGMPGTAKHFPGHGDTETDSHTNLAVIPSDSSRLWSVELPPFIAAIEDGIDLVMMTHVQAPDYQTHAGTPATLSKFWVTDILRDQLGFKGAVITDAMGMGGITQNFSEAYALIEAINAGCDIIIQNYNFSNSVDIVEQAVKEGLISEERINAAALQMLKLKEKSGLHRNRYTDIECTRKVFGNPEFGVIAHEMASKAITLVKNDGDLVPLRLSSKEDTIYVIDLYDYPYNHRLSSATRQILGSGLPIKPIQLDESDPIPVYQAVVDSVAEGARVIVNAFCATSAFKDRIFLPDHQLKFIKALNAKTDRLIITSFGTPYLLQAFPGVPAYLTAYHNSPLMQQAVASALMGQKAISGRLPITIPGVADRGTGIQLAADTLQIPEEPPPLAHLIRVMPAEIGAETSDITSLLNTALEDSTWPGGVLLAARNGKIFIHEAFGYHTYSKVRPTTRGDIFDLASITKPVATASAVAKLMENGHLDLDDKVVSYIPDFRGPTQEHTILKSQVTIRHLLTHTSGLPGWRPIFRIPGDAQARLDSIYALPMDTIPGAQYKYSDMGMIILGKIVDRVAGVPLAQFVQDSIYQRLGMSSTYYNPPVTRLKRMVPTEFDTTYRHRLMKGEVQGENSYSLGGAAGNSGLFSTAADLAIFSQMMLNGGTYRDSVIFQPETIKLFTRRANVVPNSARGLSWDTPAGEAYAGIYVSSNSYGHKGFTGTSLWIDPDSQMVVILLTNVIHPNRKWKTAKYKDWLQRIHSAVYECFPNPVQNPELKWRERWASGSP
jgi:beta-glucosidase-like glycosyl hydrolase/CubicO group peptidase (beta-lactamase class C family)